MKNSSKIGVAAALLAAVAGVVFVKSNRPAAHPAAAVAEVRLPKLIDLGAGQCVPCKLMAPILEELKQEQAGRLTVEFIDVWKNPDAGEQYKIEGIPTQIFFDASGKELFRHGGFFGKEDILAKWKELGVDLPGTAPQK